MDLESKKEKYYQWLVDHLINLTDVDSDKIKFKFASEWLLNSINGKQYDQALVYRITEPWNKSSFLYDQFEEYLINNMGVTSEHEVRVIWDRYLPKIWEKIRGRGFKSYYNEQRENQINESEDKYKRFINFVIQDIINTQLDFNGSMVKFIFNEPCDYTSINDIKSKPAWQIFDYEIVEYPTTWEYRFVNLLNKRYGIDKTKIDEIDYIFNKIINYIISI